MYNENILFQTRYSKVIFIRPLVVALIPILWLLLSLTSQGGFIVGCLNFVAIIFLLRCAILAVWRLFLYTHGSFIATDRRIIASGEGKAIDIFLHQLEGIDYLVHPFIPYPLSRRILRIRGIGGSVYTFHDVENIDQLKYRIDQSIMQRQYVQ